MLQTLYTLMFSALQGLLSISSGVKKCLAKTLVASASMVRQTTLNIFDVAFLLIDAVGSEQLLPKAELMIPGRP